MMHLSNLVLIATLWAALALPALTQTSTLPSPVSLDAAALKDLPRQHAQMDVGGNSLDWTGISLAILLQKAGAMPTTPLRGTQLARVVDVQAADRYRVVFSLGELQAGLGKTT